MPDTIPMRREFELGDFVLTEDNRLAVVNKVVLPGDVMIELFMNDTGATRLQSKSQLRRVRIQPCVRIFDMETGELILERNERL